MISNKEFYKEKKVLVTGGAGCIGSHLVEKLLDLEANVIIYDNFMRKEEAEKNIQEIKGLPPSNIILGDILDFEKLKELFQKEQFDFVFHLAALPSHRLALEQPRNYLKTDIEGTGNILEAARLTSKPTVIFASSNKIYGKQKPPFKEDKIPMPEGPYGQAKLCSEEWCMQYSKYFGLNTPVVRYHHVLGPRTQPDRELSIFTERILNNENPIVHGKFEGDEFVSCSADYTDVNDAVEATLLAGQVKGFDVFNIATGKETSVEDIARQVMTYLDKELPIEHRQMLAHESLVHLSDVSKAQEVLGFTAQTPMEQSVKDYVEWRKQRGPRPQAVYK